MRCCENRILPSVLNPENPVNRDPLFPFTTKFEIACNRRDVLRTSILRDYSFQITDDLNIVDNYRGDVHNTSLRIQLR
jgi:hypothetical protein